MDSVLPASRLATTDRRLPVPAAFASVLPGAGLQRGCTIGCTGPASMSLALAVVTPAIAAGSWLAVLGVPSLGVEAVHEAGLPLSRVVMICSGDGVTVWAERLAVAADGFEVVLTRPPRGADRAIRKVQQRLQARGVVLVMVAPRSLGVGCDVELSSTAVEWSGLGAGHGRLARRLVHVEVGGRRVPHRARLDLWLPGPDGLLAAVDPIEHEAHVDLVRAG